jgi:hypothetical protein
MKALFSKKAAADDMGEEIGSQPNVVDDSAPSAVKVLIKEKKESSIKKNSTGVTFFIEKLTLQS